MNWARILAYVTGTVDQDLLARYIKFGGEVACLVCIARPTPPVPIFLGRSRSSEERAVTPTYKRNLGLIFIIINVGYLLFALFTGRMEGLGGLPDLFTNLHDVPTTLAGKPFAFVFGFVAHAAIAVMGVKLLREALKEGA